MTLSAALLAPIVLAASPVTEDHVLPPNLAAANVTQAEWNATQALITRLTADLQRSNRQLDNSRTAHNRTRRDFRLALESIATALFLDDPDADLPQILQALEEQAQQLAYWRSEAERFRVLAEGNDQALALLSQAEDAIYAGDFEQASTLLQQVTALFDQRAAEQAASFALYGWSLILGRFDYAGAANAFERAAELTPPDNTQQRREYRIQQAGALTTLGMRSGERVAIQQAASVLSNLPGTVGEDVFSQAQALLILAAGLELLGERGDQDAISTGLRAAERALELFHQQNLPVWEARSRIIIGGLYMARDRMGDPEAGALAVTQYEAALPTLVGAEHLTDRTTIKLNIAVLKGRQGERGDMDALNAAIADFEDLIPRIPPQTEPDRYIYAISGLAGSLVTAADHGAPGAAAKAIRLTSRVLEEDEARLTPVTRGIILLNLGAAQYLEGLSGDRALLERSIETNQAAARLLNREDNASSWVRLQINIGLARLELAEADDEDALRSALAPLDEALATLDEAAAPQPWTQVQIVRAIVLGSLMTADHIGPEAPLEAARSARSGAVRAQNDALVARVDALIAELQARAPSAP